MRAAWAIFCKDLRIEWRSRERVLAMGLFSLLAVMVFHFALPGGATAETRRYAPGLLWATYLFSALFGLGRSFSLELDNEALAGLALAPIERGQILLGKTAANLVVLGVSLGLTTLAFALVFDLPLASRAPALAGIAALGSLGLATLGSFFSAMAIRTRFREVMLPLLMLPLCWPLLGASVRATRDVLESGSVPFETLQLLIAADAIYLIVSFLAFDYVLDD